MDSPRRAVLDRAAEMGAPILISANSLWNGDKRSFTSRWRAYAGFDIALDSGGFVAMKLYGGYRWSVVQYVALAQAMSPTWWAQMDFCCEPEIASAPDSVAQRIDLTARHLSECNVVAQQLGASRPMPVLQGWKPDDYCRGPAYDGAFTWPELVGVGSVCRRPVHGRTGVLAVVYALDQALPSHVRLHLFGVKSGALSVLLQEVPHRIASMDSMAWSMAARRHCHQQATPCTESIKSQFMSRWYESQMAHAIPPESVQPRLL
jgi:queuine/archaeosine tRNA-ribosyltransferase